MKPALLAVLVTVMAAGPAGWAHAQQAAQAAVAPASAASAASRLNQTRSPAVRAAEKAKEPGILQPEQRVIPQISVPLKNRNSPSPATPAASLPAGSVSGAVNDDAARCLAADGAKLKAACERGRPASGPASTMR